MDEQIVTNTENGVMEYPLLPIRDTVMFPYMVTPLFVGRDRSVRAVEAASNQKDDVIIVVSQKDSELLEPAEEDLYRVGTEVSIGSRPGQETCQSHRLHPGGALLPSQS